MPAVTVGKRTEGIGLFLKCCPSAWWKNFSTSTLVGWVESGNSTGFPLIFHWWKNGGISGELILSEGIGLGHLV